jgi:hypothetical protein
MKEYNDKKWWINNDVVRDMRIEAESVKQALKVYQENVKEKDYIIISDNALKTKKPMYVDTKEGNVKQVGYVITGQTEFVDSGRWSKQYIDLWVTIITVIDTEF